MIWRNIFFFWWECTVCGKVVKNTITAFTELKVHHFFRQIKKEIKELISRKFMSVIAFCSICPHCTYIQLHWFWIKISWKQCLYEWITRVDLTKYFFGDMRAHCGNYRNLLSRISYKNFVKSTLLLKNWFHGKNFRGWERISRFSTLCWVNLWLFSKRIIDDEILLCWLLQGFSNLISQKIFIKCLHHSSHSFRVLDFAKKS